MSSNLTTNLNIEELYKDKDTFKRYLASIYFLEQYTNYENYNVNKMESDFKSIGEKYLSKLEFKYEERIEKLKKAIQKNQQFLDEVIKKFKPQNIYYTGIDMYEIRDIAIREGAYIDQFILKYIMRDWTEDKKLEREKNYGIILNEVKEHFISNSKGSQKYKFLIPGAGLIRLAYEIANYGFDVEANDFCLFNVIFSEYICNYCTKNQHEFYPLISSFRNWLKEDSPFKGYSFPDVDINMERKGKLTMSAGNFLTLYLNQFGEYDCVITCFFIDTAQNILEYIELIYNLLKKGGIWINFGPLAYHYSGIPNSISIELPYDELKSSIKKYGFTILKEKTEENVAFCRMDGNLKNDYYDCIFFSAQKE